MKQDIRFCTSFDGVKLAYAVSGEGPPLVMSATWLTHLEHQWRSLAWRPWLDAFSREHTVLRYDSRGCGLSDRDAHDLSFQTWVRDLECVIDAAGLRRFALLATCQGGPIAIAYADRHPERVSHLILYGTFARGRLKWTNRQNNAERTRLLLDLTRLGWGQGGPRFPASMGVCLPTWRHPRAFAFLVRADAPRDLGGNRYSSAPHWMGR